MKKVGFIGLGIMGRPMAKNVLKSGKADLYVFDLNQAAVDEMVGLGAKSATVAEMGKECDFIIMSLPNGFISIDTLFKADGVASQITPGTIVIDTSSVTPGQSKQCYEGLKKKGAGFLDCPVSGGEPKAIDGTLAFMAGGDQADFDAALEIIYTMAASAILVGPSGSGSVTKLANQIIVNLNIAAVSEAYVLAAKAGADPALVYKAIHSGLAGSVVMDAKVPLICSRNFVPGGKISINHKDIKNVLATAHEIDCPVPFTAQLFEIQQALKVAGHFNEDHCAYVKFFEQLADVEVKSDNF